MKLRCFDFWKPKPTDVQCPVCMEIYNKDSEYHCMVSHRTYDRSNPKIIEEHKKALEKGEIKALDLDNVPPHISQMKNMLLRIQNALPKDAIEESISTMEPMRTNIKGCKDLMNVGLSFCDLVLGVSEDWLKCEQIQMLKKVKYSLREKKASRMIESIKAFDMALLYTMEEKKKAEMERALPAKREAQKRKRATEWGFIPGQQYLDEEKNIVCVVECVDDNHLLLRYGRRNERLSRESARRRLFPLSEYENCPSTSSNGVKRRRDGTETASSETRSSILRQKHKQKNCTYCRCDITGLIHITCAECKDVHLCLDCFAEGVEIDEHKNTHNYHVNENVATPIFEPHWGADEELALLDAIKKFGYGNWEGVSGYLMTKSPEECKRHYIAVYLRGKFKPLPHPNFVRKKNVTKYSSSDAPLLDSPKTPTSNGAHVKKESASSSVASKVTSKSSTNKSKHQKNTLLLANQVGFMMERGDFDVEWEDDAEDLLADMEFTDQDTNHERKLKLRVLEIYNSKLDSREERKRFVLERGLLQRPERKPSTMEQIIEEKLKIFARFHSVENHKKLISGLIEEQLLREKIAKLEEELRGKRASIGTNREQDKKHESLNYDMTTGTNRVVIDLATE